MRWNLSPSQKKEVQKQQIKLAKILVHDHTQEEVAGILGVSREWVSKWTRENGTNGTHTNTSDSRVKVPPQAAPEIVGRVESGESREQVAADYGVTPRC